MKPSVSGGALVNMAKLIVLLDARLEDLLSFTTSAPGTDEVQLVTISGNPNNGTFTLNLTVPDGGGLTGPIPCNPISGDIYNALIALPGVDAADVNVSQRSPGVFEVAFQGGLGSLDIGAMAANASFNKGGVTVSTETQGAPAGAGVTAKTELDGSGGELLVVLSDAEGGRWTYQVMPAVNHGSTLISFLGRLSTGVPNAPVSPPGTEMEWREAVVRYQAPVGSPEPTRLQGMAVVE
jgi:hypothetical protein